MNFDNSINLSNYKVYEHSVIVVLTFILTYLYLEVNSSSELSFTMSLIPARKVYNLNDEKNLKTAHKMIQHIINELKLQIWMERQEIRSKDFSQS